MAITYTEKSNELGWEYIERTNEDGSISVIPKDEGNSDYQAYLNPVEHLTEIPTPPAE
jgi:anti-sigma regulatory factor (Ser/Thr protein kinase)